MDINKHITKNKLDANHLLSLNGFSAEDIFEILHLTKKIKLKAKAKEKVYPLQDKIVAFILDNKNSGFRAPFELSVKKLGAAAIHLHPSNEYDEASFKDEITALKLYGVNIGVIKETDEKILKDLEKSPVPLINCLDGLDNPCQVLADLFTLWELKGGLSGLKLTIINGDKTLNASTINTYSKAGISVTVVTPKRLTPTEENIELASQFEDLKITDSLTLGLKDADAITTHYTGYDNLSSAEKLALSDYKIEKSSLLLTKPETLIMHNFPVKHEIEMSDEVLYGPHSTLYLSAENLVYIQQAVVLMLLAK